LEMVPSLLKVKIHLSLAAKVSSFSENSTQDLK